MAALLLCALGSATGLYLNGQPGGVVALEGFSVAAYRDGIGIPTICIGETQLDGRAVRMGETLSVEQCQSLFLVRLDQFSAAVEKCTARPVPDRTHAAMVSLAYNIGDGGFCRSSIARFWNKGRKREACEAFMLYDRAGGRVLSGLVTRRRQERDLCLEGIR